MSNITESVDVQVPISTVYNQWTQFETFPEFMDGVDQIEQHPEERAAWKSDERPHHAGVITFHRLGENTTRVTARMDIDPEGFIENVADKTGILDRRVKGDMARFKDFIEHRDTETGSWRGEVERPSS